MNLVGAKIDGQLICGGGTFEKGLLADAVNVGGVFLNQGFNAKGDVSLASAQIETELNCSGGTFEGNLDLRRAHTGALADDPASWPKPGKLFLDGFEYTVSSTRGVPRDAERRLNWIELGPNGPDDPFMPQPYEQLAKVLHAMGDEAGARRVSIKERWELRKQGRLGLPARVWNWFLYLTVGYGYRAWLALPWAAAVIIAGALIFQPAKYFYVADAKVPLVASAPAAAPQKSHRSKSRSLSCRILFSIPSTSSCRLPTSIRKNLAARREQPLFSRVPSLVPIRGTGRLGIDRPAGRRRNRFAEKLICGDIEMQTAITLPTGDRGL